MRGYSCSNILIEFSWFPINRENRLCCSSLPVSEVRRGITPASIYFATMVVTIWGQVSLFHSNLFCISIHSFPFMRQAVIPHIFIYKPSLSVCQQSLSGQNQTWKRNKEKISKLTVWMDFHLHRSNHVTVTACYKMLPKKNMFWCGQLGSNIIIHIYGRPRKLCGSIDVWWRSLLQSPKALSTDDDFTTRFVAIYVWSVNGRNYTFTVIIASVVRWTDKSDALSIMIVIVGARRFMYKKFRRIAHPTCLIADWNW